MLGIARTVNVAQVRGASPDGAVAAC